jgi:Uncharacterized protein conserved in bacteria (DUF2252)
VTTIEGAAASGRPWEKDVKRLAASLAIAGRESGLGAKDRAAAVRAVRAVLTVLRYRETQRGFAALRNLDRGMNWRTAIARIVVRSLSARQGSLRPRLLPMLAASPASTAATTDLDRKVHTHTHTHTHTIRLLRELRPAGLMTAGRGAP